MHEAGAAVRRKINRILGGCALDLVSNSARWGWVCTALFLLGDRPTKKSRRTTVHLLLALTLFAISCDLSTLVTPAVPTSVPGGVNTIIAQTAEAAATQTALLAPSPTQTSTLAPLPTNTPTVTPL
ncbi:MAG: hypothetical protein ACXWNQ_05175, partial [Anaerolineales bacterium]